MAFIQTGGGQCQGAAGNATERHSGEMNTIPGRGSATRGLWATPRWDPFLETIACIIGLRAWGSPPNPPGLEGTHHQG
jgi:hypothetical protein